MPDLKLVSITTASSYSEYGCVQRGSRVLSQLSGVLFQIHMEEPLCQKLVRSLAIAAGPLAEKN